MIIFSNLFVPMEGLVKEEKGKKTEEDQDQIIKNKAIENSLKKMNEKKKTPSELYDARAIQEKKDGDNLVKQTRKPEDQPETKKKE